MKTNANKAKGLKKTQQRALARPHTSIKCLEKEVSTLRRKMKTRNKQIEHLRNKIKSKSSTPMKETEEELRGLSLTPKKK